MKYCNYLTGRRLKLICTYVEVYFALISERQFTWLSLHNSVAMKISTRHAIKVSPYRSIIISVSRRLFEKTQQTYL